MTGARRDITSQSDSLIEILIAQCADLETLLTLARCETEATERKDFAEVVRVVSERAAIGERLESYHRQIAEMRQCLGESAQEAIQSGMAQTAVKLILDIQQQDEQTRPLLLRSRNETVAESFQLEQARRSTRAYLREATPLSVACDRLA